MFPAQSEKAGRFMSQQQPLHAEPPLQLSHHGWRVRESS